MLRQSRQLPIDLLVAGAHYRLTTETELRLEAFVQQRGMGQPVRIVEAEANGGFSFGNNLAIEPWLHSLDPNLAGTMLLLNLDTKLQPGALWVLLRFVEEHPAAGIFDRRVFCAKFCTNP